MLTGYQIELKESKESSTKQETIENTDTHQGLDALKALFN